MYWYNVSKNNHNVGHDYTGNYNWTYKNVVIAPTYNWYCSILFRTVTVYSKHAGFIGIPAKTGIYIH